LRDIVEKHNALLCDLSPVENAARLLVGVLERQRGLGDLDRTSLIYCYKVLTGGAKKSFVPYVLHEDVPDSVHRVRVRRASSISGQAHEMLADVSQEHENRAQPHLRRRSTVSCDSRVQVQADAVHEWLRSAFSPVSHVHMGRSQSFQGSNGTSELAATGAAAGTAKRRASMFELRSSEFLATTPEGGDSVEAEGGRGGENWPVPAGKEEHADGVLRSPQQLFQESEQMTAAVGLTTSSGIRRYWCARSSCWGRRRRG
jgi:hypothetical protein